jgi:heptosyltransferase-1
MEDFPEAKIDWVIEESFADMLKLNPEINKIIPLAIRRWRKHLFNKSTWQEIGDFKNQLQAHHYDYIIDTQTLLKSAFIACLAKGKRYGQGPSTSREWLAGFFYNKHFSVSREQHAVDQNRQLTALAMNYRAPTECTQLWITKNGPHQEDWNSIARKIRHGFSCDKPQTENFGRWDIGFLWVYSWRNRG